ncbi:MAG: F0F1 ATP synthase subunit epsilon [Candidatus Caldatribacteriota bacterium]|nr:F0F1 ATP synthase subunit epsilon [Candidatus Caldatribacteriota bacterium]
MIDLKILLPEKTFLKKEVKKITAEAENGWFCLMPKHVDFTTSLVPGILIITLVDGEDVYLAIDEGILVKYGKEVIISTRNAIEGEDLGELKNRVEEIFIKTDEKEKDAQVALSKLEADFVRSFLNLETHE